MLSIFCRSLGKEEVEEQSSMYLGVLPVVGGGKEGAQTYV
jgi:hypothetical protein